MKKILDEYSRRWKDGPLPAPEIAVSYDPKTQRITASMPVGAAGLAQMILDRYCAGETHEQVTDWLEEAVPDFRRVFVEARVTESVRFPVGMKMWGLMVRGEPGFVIKATI